MKNKRIISLLCLFLTIVCCGGSAVKQRAESYEFQMRNSEYPVRRVCESVYVAVWPGCALSAFTMTFDDATNDHRKHVLELLRRHGLRGTFYLNTRLIGLDDSYYGVWSDFREILDAGNEIGAHTLTHPHLKTLKLGSPDEKGSAIYEIVESGREVERHFPGYRCLTFSYPYSERNESIEKEVAKRHIAARYDLFDYPLLKMNDQSPENWSRLKNFIAFFPARRVFSGDDLPAFEKTQRIILKTIDDRRWGIMMIHRVLPFEELHDDRSFHPMGKEWFGNSCRMLRDASDAGLIYVDTAVNITKYIRERDKLSAWIRKRSQHYIVIHFDSVLDTVVYDFPLTVEMKVPHDWIDCGVEISGREKAREKMNS